jgi:hypothetical protein
MRRCSMWRCSRSFYELPRILFELPKAVATQSPFHLPYASNTARYQVFLFLYKLPYHSCPCSGVPARRTSDVQCQVQTPRSSFVYPLSLGAWTASEKSEGRSLAVSHSIGRESPRQVCETNSRSRDPPTCNGSSDHRLCRGIWECVSKANSDQFIG